MTRVRRRKRRRQKKVITRSMKLGLVIFFCCAVGIFGALLAKIYYLNSTKVDEYKKKVLSQQTYVNKSLNYRRGEIVDCHQTTLAYSSRVFNVILEPRTILSNEKYYKPTIEALTECFDITEEEIKKIIEKKPESLYEKIDQLKELTPSEIKDFESRMKAKNSLVKGVSFEEAYIRKYPLKTLASDILGFASKDNVGSYGVEEQYNDVLNGSKGREYNYFDSEMKLQRVVRDAENGNNVALTIDANVQQIVEKHIQKFRDDIGVNKNIGVMLMNPQNGEIIAMSSDNTYDLNNPRDLSSIYEKDQIEKMSDNKKLKELMKMWSNFCITDGYEPGSTYKPFTVAACLDEGVVKDGDHFTCDGGQHVGGRTIHCSNRNGHGDLTLCQALMKSCNDAMMNMGLRLGRNRFMTYNQMYGFGQKTGIDLPGEGVGLLHTREQLNPVELCTSCFGQTQTMTMVQMLSGFCSLINGGNYYEPHVVKEVQNEKGDVIESKQPVLVKKTTTEKTSKLLRNYLFETVENGTAQPAKVEGYEIGGKTGTAEKRPLNNKKYLVSFIGFTPVKKPEVAVYVVIDEPNVAEQAHSTYATEFASKLMKEVLPFLGVYSK